MRSFLAALLLVLFSINPTWASRHDTDSSVKFDRHAVSHQWTVQQPAVSRVVKRKHRSAKRHRVTPRRDVVVRSRPVHNRASSIARIAARGESTIVAHPPGCPSRSFCGCGVSLYIFGKAVTAGGLAIAANWLGFPKADEIGPGKVAARRGHVFAILSKPRASDGKVLAYDPNSGRHATRVHWRSLAGFSVRDPRGSSKWASAI